MSGLTRTDVNKKLKKYGLNIIREKKKRGMFKLFLAQFRSPLILVLLFAAIVSGIAQTLANEPITDSLLIMFIVLISGMAGFFQEYKAEKSIEALKKISAPKAKVIREGKLQKVETALIVPDDIVILEEGDIVPADGKMIDGKINIDQSVLTGESSAVKKKKGDEIFMNTVVVSGHGTMLVTKTGMKTEIGKIAERMQIIERKETPFQKDIKTFAKKVTIGIALITTIMFFTGLIKFGLMTAFLVAVSLAVAAIPEGLPAVSTLALAVGARDMAKKKAVIRRLGAVESLGSVDVICTDKTGTLTRNIMNVEKVFYFSKRTPKELLLCSALCNNARKEGKKYFGDQTEVAIRKFAERKGYMKEVLENEYKRIKEIPFTSERKMMSVVYKHRNKVVMFSKGAPEIIIKKCKYVLKDGKIKRFSKKEKQVVLNKNKEFASSAYRILGFGFKRAGGRENNLIFIGLEALRDEIKSGVSNAIKECKNAGIRTIMVTGDNPNTALAIANEIGLETNGFIDCTKVQNIEKYINSGVNVFARVSPFHKLKILEILQKNGHRVAVTGDGVNDALMLKKADVGASMNIRGSEVAKQASDIILLDDNFATLKTGIKYGRRIFDNIRKFVNYLFTSNFAEVSVIFLTMLLFTFREPVLMPIHVLWINLLTDGLPALALGMDPAPKQIMKRRPEHYTKGLLNIPSIIAIGVELTIMLMIVFLLMLSSGFEVARTTLFTGLVIYELIRIASIRWNDQLKMFSNKWLVVSIIVSILLQIFILYSPLNTHFHVVPLNGFAWVVLSTIGIVGFVGAVVLTKIIRD